MFKVMKKLMVLWMLFIMVALVGGGGDQLRSLQGDAGWVTEKIVDILAAKADSLKHEMDTLRERLQEWSGNKKDLASNSI